MIGAIHVLWSNTRTKNKSSQRKTLNLNSYHYIDHFQKLQLLGSTFCLDPLVFSFSVFGALRKLERGSWLFIVGSIFLNLHSKELLKKGLHSYLLSCILLYIISFLFNKNMLTDLLTWNTWKTPLIYADCYTYIYIYIWKFIFS